MEKDRPAPTSSPHPTRAQSRRAAPPSEEGEQQQATDPQDQGSGTEAGEFFRDLAGTTSRVVYQAASILEEEIAAGIVAAKDVEGRLMGSSALPQGGVNPLLRRFRRDLHDVVDLVIDLLNGAAEYAGLPTQPGIVMRGAAPGRASPLGNGRLPTLAVPGVVAAGEVGEVVLALENNLSEPSGEIGFLSTDLVSAAGERITARQVRFAPDAVALGPGEIEEVLVTVQVPRGKGSGAYSGLIRATGGDQMQAVLVVQVG